MIQIQFLTMVGCHNCETARQIFNEVLTDFSNVKVEEIDITSEKGQALASEYSVMASPGIVIDKKLFSTGGVDKSKLLHELKSLTG